MASNEVKLTIRVGDDGSLDVVAKQAKKAAKATEDIGKATERTTKARKNYNKGEKGVIGATSNSTKAFSKMRDSMTGSSGLVSAYAILASNVFAATAAFNALRRAAQIEQLEQGLRLVGAAAGQNLPDIAKGLKEITGNAVSAEQAMRSTALAVSSGFRSDQLQELTKVAKGASLALGRDMGDALDRLVRGTAKLEPEILDELGIMVRLDDAVQTYADRLGIAEGNLTQFDRRQAFLNATIEQGLKKFEDLSKGVDSNPYDKLAAALADLQKNLINAITGFTGFTSAVEFASRNLGSLTAVATTLGLSVTRGVAPGLFNMASASADAAKGFLSARVELAEMATTGGKLPPKFRSLVSSLQKGTATADEFNTANASLTGQLGALTRQLNRADEGTKEYAKLEGEIAGVRNQLAILPQLQSAQADATREQAAANAIGAASSLNFKETVKNLGIQLDEDKKKTEEATKGKKGLRTSLTRLGPAFKVGVTGAKAFGAALFTALPYIGLIVSAVSILYGIIKEKFFPEDLVKKRIDEAVESFEQFSEIQARFTASRSDDGTRLVESYIALAGVLDQISGKIREVEAANTGDLVKTAIEEQKEYANLTQQIELQTKYRQDAYDLQKMGISQTHAIADANDRINDALERQQEIRANEASLAERISEQQKTSAAAVLQGALLQLRVQQKIAKQQGVSTFNLDIMKNTYKDLEDLQQRLAKGHITYEAFLVELEIIQRYPSSIRAAFQGVSDTVASFNSVINKRQQKTQSLFQSEEEAAQGVIDQFETLSKKAQETVEGIQPFSAQALIQTGNMGGFTEEAIEAQKLLAELRKQIEGLNISDEFKNGEEGVRSFIAFIKKTRDEINILRTSIEEQKIQLKGVGQAISGIAGGQSLFLQTQNALLQDQVAEVDKRIEAARTLSNLSEEDFLNSEEYNKLLQERTRYETQIVDEKIIQKRAQVDLLRLTEQENALAKTRIKSQEKALAIAKRMAAIGAKLTPKEEFELQVKSAKNLIKAAEIDLELTIEKAKLQRELLILEMTANEVSKEKQEEVLKLLDAQLKITERIARQKVSDARLGVTGTVAAGVSERGTEFSSMPTEGYGVEAIVKRAAAMQEYSRAVQVAAEAENNQTAARQAAVKARESVTAAEDALKAGKGTQEALDQAKADAAEAEANLDAAVSAVLAAQRQVRHAAISMVADTLTSMSAALAELGPDGAVAAAFGNFNATLLTSMTSTLEIIEAKGIDSFEGMASAAATAANVIGGIGSILKAQSQQEIAAIDRQIEAEKKRDGKSAESLAKLKQLEKKKEAMKRKEFQTDKKVKLAQAIMSTAAGIAQALSLGPLIGPIMASIVAAMGAAQIAIISGMSYQGGGGAASVGAPSQISLGDRRGTVDLAKSQSARGELAYFRGESGTGGPENFRNAFAGYKNRAEGGNTAYMVGEQGPELFVPEMPGRIVPNDDIAPAGATNVSFNINTVDATGVEDLLVAQRGNIIGMIRQAANSYGQDFVEEVDTSVFTQSAGGVNKY